MTKQEQFFYDNAGYSVATGESNEQGHIRSAKELAEAETFACAQNWQYLVEPDCDADESWLDGEPAEYQKRWRGTAWLCLLQDADGKILGSLGGCYGDSDYVRVVKAELALEAMQSEDFSDYIPPADIPVAV